MNYPNDPMDVDPPAYRQSVMKISPNNVQNNPSKGSAWTNLGTAPSSVWNNTVVGLMIQ